jgi:hypothetical protein
MAALESITIRVGTEIAKKVYELCIKEPLRKGTIADALSNKGVGLLESRRAQRQFEHMAETVAVNLQSILEHESAHLESNELQAALLAVQDSIAKTNLDLDGLLDSDLDPAKIELQVRRSSVEVLKGALLNAAAVRVYDLVLSESCNYIVEIATTLPAFNSRAFRQLLARESSMRHIVEEVLAKMPSAPFGGLDPYNDFEVQYRRAIARRLDVLQLFGVTLSEAAQRYSLDVAYISLSASSEPSASGLEPEDSLRRETSTDSGEIVVESEVERIEKIVARNERLLIKGEAGSGKTTLLQWLAVRSARSAFTGAMNDMNGTVPFLIQLRRYVGVDFPSPEQFLAKTLPAIAGAMPVGWVHNHLSGGRGLLLIDGVDELPEAQRPKALTWLEELANTFNQCRLVITSRPSAISDSWQRALGLVTVELQSMSTQDIYSFIDHWHAAAKKTVPDGEEKERLDTYGTQLKRVVRTTRAIRSLAGSPLLCAMLCALNRDRRTRLPADRMALYRIALETMLERRDIERDVHTEVPDLSLREKEVLLQDIAFWMILNGHSDAERTVVEERVTRRLAGMPHVKGSATDVFNHLLTRTGLIREPVIGRVDFVHRTFQEYLGAKEAIEEDHVPLIIQRSTEDQWREVVILSCGHATTAQRETLLTGLLDRGDEQEANRHVLHLLAVACLETATTLSHELLARITKSLQGLVPPKSMTEARLLASAGDLAVSALPANPRGQRATTTAACVRVLATIGNDHALERLKAYGSDARRTVQKELIRAWNLFDAIQYAKEVMGNSPLDKGHLTIGDPDLLEATLELNNLKSLACDFGNRIDTLAGLEGRRDITALSLMGNDKIDRLQTLATLSNLFSLDIDSCMRVSDFSPLMSCQKLTFLDISRTRIESLHFLPHGKSLDTLILHNCGKLTTLSGISRSEGITRLSIMGSKALTDWSELASCRSLVSVNLRGVALMNLEVLPSESDIRVLELFDVDITTAQGLGKLEDLRLLKIGKPPRDLADGIASLSHLSTVNVTQGVLDGRLPDVVKHVSLTSTKNHDLECLPSGLLQLQLNRCKIQDYSALVKLKKLRRLRILRSPIPDDLDFLSKLDGVSLTLDRSWRKEVPQDVAARTMFW